MMKHQRSYTIKGFSILELLMVAAIVIVIAAFAIPGYLNYVFEAKVNALWHEAEPAKLAVSGIYVKQGTPVADITVFAGAEDYTSSLSELVKCITIQNGIVSVVGNSTEFGDKDIWIAWEPTDTGTGITWSCIYSADAQPYLSGTTDTCAQQTCQEFSSWETPTTVSTETFWYFGTLSQAQVSSAFANNCNTTGSMAGCGDCYNYANSNTTQRYMTFDLSNTTYNYQGALGADPTWNSYSSWSYQYDYTVVTQSCMQQTRTESSCANVNPFAGDPQCT